MTIKQLNEFARQKFKEKHPNVPVYALSTPKYNDQSANSLTKCIVDYINMIGGRADRISSAGRYIDESKTYKDSLGLSRTIGTGKWVPGATRRGYADINATIQGRSIMIEVKMKDKLSGEQVRFAEAERRAGGQYWIVHNWEEFYDQCIDFINPKDKIV